MKDFMSEDDVIHRKHNPGEFSIKGPSFGALAALLDSSAMDPFFKNLYHVMEKNMPRRTTRVYRMFWNDLEDVVDKINIILA